MATKAKPVTAWAVFDTDGYVILSTIRKTKRGSIDRVFDSWCFLKKCGYTCRKIQITEAEK